jgi:hypothetical protein
MLVRRYLVVANKTLGGDELVQAIYQRIADGPCEFYVLVPATSSASSVENYGPGLGGGLPVLPRADEKAVSAARRRLDAEVHRIRKAGAPADGEVGDPDPLRAISNLLARRQFDEIILSTLPRRLSHWLHWDLPSRVQRKFQLPVTHVRAREPTRP